MALHRASRLKNACFKDHLNVVQYLIEHPALRHDVTRLNTALHSACERSHLDVTAR